MTDKFIKLHLELIELGLPKTLVALYGRIEYKAEKRGGEWWVSRKTLAKELDITVRQVQNLTNQLVKLKLLEWTRKRYCNRYRPLPPDRKLISYLKKEIHFTSQIGNQFPTEKDIRSSSRRSPKTPPSPTPSPGKGRATKRSPKPAPPESGQKHARSLRSDDDEFAARLGERHGPDFDAKRCTENVRRQLEKAGLTLADFLGFDTEHTTGATFTNPNGYYVHLAQQCAKAARKAAADALKAPLREAAERSSEGPCPKCGGKGGLAPEYCDCRMGRELARISKRKTAATITPQKAKGA